MRALKPNAPVANDKTTFNLEEGSFSSVVSSELLYCAVLVGIAFSKNERKMNSPDIYASKIATSIAATPPLMSNKVAPAPLLDFSMNVSVGLGAEAFTVETPPTPPFTSGPPKLPEAAAESVVSGVSPLRAGVRSPTLPATEAGVVPALDVPLPPAPPDAPVLAVPLVDNEALP
jgi:hypothetical protein